jgi:predicted site-specific integrase-resolvase
MALPRYMTLPEAASVLGTSLANLNRMVQSGTIKAVEIAGEVIVSENSVLSTQKGRKVQPISVPQAGVQKQELPEYKKYANLENYNISISDAAKKYAVPFSVLQKWSSKGYMTIVRTEGRRVLLKEQDVAYCVEIYREAKKKGYRWIFYADGTPYIPKLALKNSKL